MPDEETTVTGLKEMADQLDQLPNRVARSCVRPALSAAGQVMQAGVKSTVPHGATGELAASIGQKIHVGKNLDNSEVIVGPRYMGGYKETSNDPGVRALFLEFGTRRGVKPTFFMRKAFAMTKAAAFDTAVAVLKGILGNLPK